MSWESSAEYYQILNHLAKEELGGLHSCKCILYSVDFNDIEILQHKDQWKELTTIMIDIAQKLENAGAEVIIIGTNTMRMMAEEVQARITSESKHALEFALKE